MIALRVFAASVAAVLAVGTVLASVALFWRVYFAAWESFA